MPHSGLPESSFVFYSPQFLLHTWIALQVSIKVKRIWDWDLLFLTSPFSVNNLTRTWAGSTCDLTTLKNTSSRLTQKVLKPRTLPPFAVSAQRMKTTIFVAASNWATPPRAVGHRARKLSRPWPSPLPLFHSFFLPFFASFTHSVDVVTVLTVVAGAKNGLLGVASGSTAQAFPARHRHWRAVEFATNQLHNRVVEGHHLVVELQQGRIWRWRIWNKSNIMVWKHLMCFREDLVTCKTLSCVFCFLALTLWTLCCGCCCY